MFATSLDWYLLQYSSKDLSIGGVHVSRNFERRIMDQSIDIYRL